MNRVLCTALLQVCLALPCSFSPAASPNQARNVILFIGDGMGLAHVEAAGALRGGQKHGAGIRWETFPVFGYLGTYSANSYVTDSAAAATAYAIGEKTANGMISVAKGDKRPASIGEIARKKGKSVGVVSSVGLNHATPAAFYARQGKRSDYDAITQQGIEGSVADVILGGGLFAETTTPVQVRAQAEARGMAVFQLENLDKLTPENVGERRVIGWFDQNNDKRLDFPTSPTAGVREPRLSELTTRTLDLLGRDADGFFLMVEGGSIDWAAHGNDAESAVGEVFELESAVEATLQWLEKKGQLEQTLIIVTADHETGGMTLPGPYRKVLAPNTLPQIKWSSTNHTAIPVMCWSQGPGAQALSGRKDNTEVFRAMKAALAP